MNGSRGLRRLLVPAALDVTSRKWAWAVNTVAASSLLRERERARLYRQLGFELESTRIKPGCFFQSARFHLGRNSSLNQGCFVENVAPIRIGERTDVGYAVRLITSSHAHGGHEQRAGAWWPHPITIGDGCWIGVGATILPGVTIADGCIVAAGSVVTRDCEPDGLYAGVPARRVKDLG